MADQYVETGYVEYGYVEGDVFSLPEGESVRLKYFVTDKKSMSDIDMAISGWKSTLEKDNEIGILFAPVANTVSLFTTSIIYRIVGGATDAITANDVLNSDEFESAVSSIILDQFSIADIVNSGEFKDAVTSLVPDAVNINDVVNSQEFSDAVSNIVSSSTSSFVTESRVETMISSAVPTNIVTNTELSASVEDSIRSNLVDIVLGNDDIKGNIYSQIVDHASSDVEVKVESRALSIIAEKLRIGNVEIRPSELSQEVITSFGPSHVTEFDNGSTVEYVVDLPEELVGKKYVINFHLATSTE